MVAKITTPKNIKAALNYNEKKVQQGIAACLYASSYLANAKDMNFYQKLAGFERLNELNDRAATKTIHISLNFDPAEKLPNEKLIGIAKEYMNKIGFGKQPFLVYKHEDAGHPHIHIVSTTIQKDGTRINTHNIGRNQSEKARKEIEQQYALVKAERQRIVQSMDVKPVNIEKALYGKAETKKSIATVVTAVFNQYKFTSLPEFNAALKQLNVMADRGREGGRIHINRGLVYRIVDVNGNKVGVPIKASSLGCKPTLAALENKFIVNQQAKEKLLPFVRAKLDECLANNNHSILKLVEQLKQKSIYTLPRQNDQGRLYGITFVDNQNKVVVNGSDLGKGYSIAGLQTRLNSLTDKNIRYEYLSKNYSGQPSEKIMQAKKEMHQAKPVSIGLKADRLIDTLLYPKPAAENLAYGFKKKRKRKKKQIDQ